MSMRAPLLALVTPLLAVALLPGAAAAIVDLSFRDGFGTAALDLEGSLHGEAAADLRAAIDSREAGGNGDGHAATSEAVHFVHTYRATFVAQVESGVLGGNLTLDGRPPTGVTVGNVSLEGAEGPVDSAAPVTTRIDAVLRFAVEAGPRHHLVSKPLPGAQGGLQMTVRAPPGYTIERAEGLSKVFDEGRTQVTFSGVGGVDREVIFVAPLSTSSSQPAPSGPLAALGLGAALALRRGQGQK